METIIKSCMYINSKFIYCNNNAYNNTNMCKIHHDHIRDINKNDIKGLCNYENCNNKIGKGLDEYCKMHSKLY